MILIETNNDDYECGELITKKRNNSGFLKNHNNRA
jgi:hypothetical protein